MSLVEEQEVRTVVVDIDLDGWTVAEARAYREAVGVNAEYALAQLNKAVAESQQAALEEFGDAVTTPGWEPPEGWIPMPMMNVDPAHLLGFAWIAARREDESLSFAALSDSLPISGLMEAFYTAIGLAAEKAAEEAAPLVNREQRRASGRQSKTGSPSRTSTAGRSPKSTS